MKRYKMPTLLKSHFRSALTAVQLRAVAEELKIEGKDYGQPLDRFVAALKLALQELEGC